MRVLFLIGISFFTLTSCVPQLNTINQVAILNGPAEYAVPDLADHFTLRVREANPSAAYQHVSSSRLRFAETHRDLFGSRANPSASLIAKTVGAEFAVLVYAQSMNEQLKITRLMIRRDVKLQQLFNWKCGLLIP